MRKRATVGRRRLDGFVRKGVKCMWLVVLAGEKWVRLVIFIFWRALVGFSTVVGDKARCGW